MNRDELIQEVKQECSLASNVNFLIPRALTEGEEILGKYLEYEEVEAPEKRGIIIGNYYYHIVTDQKFVRIFSSETECWYKVCYLDRFVGVEEKILIPGSLEVNINFDVTDNDLRQIKFTVERTDRHRETKQKKIENFMSALMTAVSNLSKKTEK